MTVTSSSAGHPALRRALAAELRRLLSAPAAWVLLGAAVLLPVAFTALSIGLSGQAGHAEPTTVMGMERLLSDGNSAVVLASLLGVLLVTTEVRYGTQAASLVAVPSRSRWLGAKAAVAAGGGLLFAALAQTGVLAVGLPMLAAKGAHLSYIRGYLIEASVGTAVAGAFAAAWGVGIGALVRNQVAAVVGTALYTVVVESVLLGAVPWLGRILPGGATAALAIDPTVAHHLGAWWGLLLWTFWATLFVATGMLLYARLEIPAPS